MPIFYDPKRCTLLKTQLSIFLKCWNISWYLITCRALFPSRLISFSKCLLLKLASPVNLASCCDAALVRSIFPLLEIYLDAKDISNFLWNRNKSESVLKSLSLRIMLVTHFKIRMNKSNSVLNFVHKSRHFCEGVTKIDVTFFNIH